MAFNIQNNPPIFLHNEQWIEYEQNNYWRKIDKIQNEFLVRLPNHKEPEFYAYFSQICKERKNELPKV